MKITTTQAETRWSQWVESMRKDVECTFGILKGRYVRVRCFSLFTGALLDLFRWRILKTGIQLHGVPVVTDIWKTCCALHNWCVLSSLCYNFILFSFSVRVFSPRSWRSFPSGCWKSTASTRTGRTACQATGRATSGGMVPKTRKTACQRFCLGWVTPRAIYPAGMLLTCHGKGQPRVTRTATRTHAHQPKKTPAVLRAKYDEFATCP